MIKFNKILCAALALTMIITMSAALTACGTSPAGSASTQPSAEENGASAAADANTQPSTDEAIPSNYPGTYTRTFTEEMEGEDVEFTNTIVLNDTDRTGTMDFQDTVDITWTNDQLIEDAGTFYNFRIEGDNLILTLDGEELIFTRTA